MPPGPPVPKIVDVTNTTIDISWVPPLYNGGGDILGYHVERCLVGEKEWVRCTESRCKDRKFTITGLTEGADYNIRVFAVNEAGHGAPGMTEPVQAKEPEGKNTCAFVHKALFLGLLGNFNHISNMCFVNRSSSG